VHDLELILEQDPWAELRADAEAEAGMEEQATDELSEVMPGDDLDRDEEAEALPPPLRFYRLDGTAQLTRSRFLHLALDVAWREPVFGELPLRPPLPPSDGVPADAEQVLPVPESFRVHRLQQRRQVRSDRVEYFDGPVLGVLARISRVAADESALENPPEEPIYD
jgi:hypothetical protein